nr:hypothetical protein [Tanacetum cinerariifolium]
RDAKIVTLKSKLEMAKSEATDVVVLRKWVSELETVAAAKAEEFANLSVQNVELLGKVSGLEFVCKELKCQVLKLKAECEDLRGEIKVNELDNVSLSLLDQPEALKDYSLMSSLTLKGDHSEEDPTPEFYSHEIMLFDALVVSHSHTEKRKKGASLSLEAGGPFAVMPFASSQETSLVVVDYQISSVTIVDGTIPATETHDDLFDTTLLDKPAKPAYYVVPNEFLDLVSCYCCHRLCLNLLEWPWRGYWCELLLGISGYQTMDLTIVTLLTLHGSLLPHTLFGVVQRTVTKCAISEVNVIPFGLVGMSSAPDPSKHEDPSIKRANGFGISSSISIHVDEASSSGFSAIKACNARLTKKIGIRYESLSVNKIALIAFLAAQRGHPSQMFKRCSAMDLKTHVMSAGFQELKHSMCGKGNRLDFSKFESANMPLYGDGDQTTMKVIRALVECSPSHNDTINDIYSSGQDISLLNPMSGVMAGVNALVLAVAFIFVELTKLVFVLVLMGPDVGGDWFATTTSPMRKAVVTLIISSTDFRMLSFSRLIKSALVMACMNSDTLMHSGTPLTHMLSALKRSMKAPLIFLPFS